MNIWMLGMLLLVTACYAGTGLIYMFQTDVWRGIFWMGYAFANFSYIKFSGGL